ncbi:Gfo/Idh/MocA family protein [Microbaculum marinisediminis]|uniref:Gfo/Idh/MocA family oxidoreductase n=1 Tax=Microbaculum marinisediminis TaxID=2931392 RepID=A0AAW5QX69_9HYPH|nr:Gfo/Idh/MocA family oxidoreductase [Microbaculum sp. A6E488]MCT8971071.1 Gfo/Idh/MocA family oxidoreductase [Microbaculum sp. A6E488]
MIGIGLVGYGYWGPNLARCVSESDGCRLAAIADASEKSRERAGQRHPSAQLHASWEEMLKDPGVDAVLIATPVCTHYEIAAAALTAGKHVLVEKPITETSEQAQRLIDMANRGGLTLMVDHTFVYTGAVRKIRDLIADGTVGDIYYYESTRINLGLFQGDVNVIWDLAVHDFAILEFILGAEPVSITAVGAGHIHRNQESLAHLSVHFDNGTLAHINVNWLAPVKVRQTLIGGSRRMIVYDDLEPSEKIKVYDRGVHLSADPQSANDVRISYRTGDMWAPQLSTREALLGVIEDFAASINGHGQPTSSGVSGLRVVRMLEAAAQSLSSGGHPVEFARLKAAS